MKKIKNILSIIMLIIICFTFGCGNSKGNNSKEVTCENSVNQSKSNKNYSSDNSLKEDKKNFEKKHEKSQSDKENKECSREKEKKDLKDTTTNKKDSKIDEKVNKVNEKVNKNSDNTKINERHKDNKVSNQLPNNKVTVVEKNDKNEKKDTSKGQDTFTLIISKESKGYIGKAASVNLKKHISVCKDKSAMTYLRENSSINDRGGFIYEINGIHNVYPIPASKKTPEQKKMGIMGIDWFIYLNDKKTSVGANDVYPKKGDVLLFDFHEWDKRELAP